MILKQRLPEYPDAMRLSGVVAVARVRFVIEKDGSVAKSEVVASGWKEADDAVTAVLKHWKFGPALNYRDEPIRATADFEFSFELIDE